MALTPGTRLGPYEITGELGFGGMGEVYRAYDTTLKRAVAIKVLPAGVAADPDRLARFQREAEVLAALNHPHIAAIYGLERTSGQTALVMELVDGPTLADRIARGPLPLDEALLVARQMAEALEAAHEQGIVHRDLKPANVKLRPDGSVKILDFGLAKAIDPASSARPDSGAILSQSPTINTPALTQLGVIVGTATYMSPEQARGRPVDKRADIWAFGCVLFEMLTASRPFEGEDVAEILGAVIHKEAAWGRLPPATPPMVRSVLRRCLEKDPKQRMRDIGDVRLALAGAFDVPVPAGHGSARRWTLPRVAVTAAIALVATGIGAALVWFSPVPAAAPIAFNIETPNVADPSSFALSPDGSTMAFSAVEHGVQRLWIRPLGSTVARAVPGTDGASHPFWAPDSRRIAYFTNDLLKQVDMVEGVSQTIARTATTVSRGGTWNDRDIILFSRAGAGLQRVAAGGGEPHSVTTLDGAAGHNWPAFLPDGERFIYVRFQGEQTDLMWRNLETGEERLVRTVGSRAAYAPSGHLLFALEDSLVSQPFDAASGTISGNTVTVASQVWTGSQGRAAFALSPAGILAYRTADDRGGISQLSWLDRTGAVLSTVAAPADYRNVVADRSATRAAANTVVDDEDVWTFEGTRGTTSRLTFDAAPDSDPVFTPDGRWLLFYSARNPPGIYRKLTSGAGADELVAAVGLQSWPKDVSVDGTRLLYHKVRDLWILPLDGDRTPYAYLATPASEGDGRFSPDGRWVSYTSDETGRLEVFVQDFPATGAKYQVSVAGGTEARWRSDGRELFYLGADGQLMSVSVERAPELRLGVPKPVFPTRLMELPLAPQRRYSVSSDGSRFLMNVPVGIQTAVPITVVVNWKPPLERP